MSSNPQVFRGSAAYLSPSPGPVVTIGNFDGVHLGHQALLDTGRRVAQSRILLAYTFDPAPRDVFRPGNPLPRIQTLEDRIASLGRAGVDHVVVETFTREFGANSARWFAEEVIQRRLGASAVVVGWDFRFGSGRSGGAEELRQWLDVPIEQFGPYEVAGEVVSSSKIRTGIQAGDVKSVARWLDRPHDVVGTVVRGQQRGRKLGYPTANVAPTTALLPASGVYAVRIFLESSEKGLPAVANVGVRPTFGDRQAVILEVHMFVFSGDIYQQTARVQFIDRIRPETRFDNSDALIAQIRDDATQARRIMGIDPS